MNTKIKTIKVLIIVCLICILTACRPAPSPPLATPTEPASPEPSGDIIQIERSYVLLSREDLIEQADEIFLGQVQRISPTRWNQDSGEYWEEMTKESDGRGQTTLPLAYYEVEFSIIRSIWGTPDGTLTVTIVGKSPVDDRLLAVHEGQQFEVQFGENLHFRVGDRLIVFVHYSTLPWRDPGKPLQRVDLPDGGYYYDPGGSRPVLCFLQEPASSLFEEGDDGLYHSLENASHKWEPFSWQELEQLVAARRETRE